MKKKLNKKGFTLIELIVVIAVIAILAAVLLPRFTGFSDSAKANKVRSNAKNYSTAVSAIIAEGNSLTTSAVITYLGGTSLGGDLTINETSTDDGYGDFMLVELINGKYYAIGYDYSDAALDDDVANDDTYTDLTATTDVTLPGEYAAD